MATRRPLVTINGRVQELPADDTLPGADPAALIHAAPAKPTPADADEFGYADSAAGWGLVKLTWENLKAALASVFLPKTGGALTGNLNFSGAARRITGDFSAGEVASRVMFQTSTVNGNTVVSTLPNGTSTVSGFRAYGSDNLVDGVSADLIASLASGDVRLISNAYGSGAYLPLTFHTGGSERMRIDTSGNVLVTNAIGIGYGVGAGGTVVQATSKSTDVTLNKPCGRITMHNAALAAGAYVLFVLRNSTISITDEVSVTMIGGVNYRVEPIDISNGACTFRVTNISGSSLSDALAFNFKVFKVSLS